MKDGKPFWKKFHRQQPWWAQLTDEPCLCDCGHEHLTAESRAWRLLIEHLSDKQLTELRRTKMFYIRGKYRWKIDPLNEFSTLEIWNKQDQFWEECCIDLDYVKLGRYDRYDDWPTGDVMLAALFAIQIDEERFYRTVVTNEFQRWRDVPKKKNPVNRRAATRTRRRG